MRACLHAPQAVDILHPWTLDPETGEELVPFTTFRCARAPERRLPEAQGVPCWQVACADCGPERAC